MSLIIENPGIASILVDVGRNGYQRLGITAGGPTDEYAFKWANALCGNIDSKTTSTKKNTTSIEIIASGARLTATQDCEVSITGAVTEVKLNDIKLSGWRNYWLKLGDTIEITKAENGLRSYLAVGGGFDVKTVFGSSTTVVRDRLGGLDAKGSVLKAQDYLPFSSAQIYKPRCLPISAIPDNSTCETIRVVAGYQISTFSQLAISCFQSNVFKVSAQSDRMAIRFAGNALKTSSVTMLSEGLCKGSVQIPPDGIPIVMLSDRQTMGGYPKIGTVLSCDCDVLAQKLAGSEIRFELISVFDAQNILHLKQQNFVKLLGVI